VTGDVPHDGEDGAGEAPSSPDLDESLRAINTARREAIGASRGTARALRRLVAADFALARGAAGRALAWIGAAVVFGASAWLLLTATLVALMQRGGLSWLQSLALATLLSVVAAAFAGWRASRYFEHVGMHATRRQLARMGLFHRNASDDDRDASPPGAAAATARPAGPAPGGA